jgi:hypothetical protein
MKFNKFTSPVTMSIPVKDTVFLYDRYDKYNSYKLYLSYLSYRNTVFFTGILIVTGDVYTQEKPAAIICMWAGKPTGCDMIFVR